MNDRTFAKSLTRIQRKSPPSLTLDQGSRVTVISGGPEGSFFIYFLLDMAERIGLKFHVDIYKPRDFNFTKFPRSNRNLYSMTRHT